MNNNRKKRKYIKPTKKHLEEARVIDEATMQMVTNRIGVMATCLEAVADELDDLNDYGLCVIPTRVDENGDPMYFHSLIPPTLSGTIRNTMAQMDRVIQPILSANDKTMFQALDVAELFKGAIEEVNKRYVEAQIKDRELIRERVRTGVVCANCGEMHKKTPQDAPKPEIGECLICGDTDVPVLPASYYNYCGYKID